MYSLEYTVRGTCSLDSRPSPAAGRRTRILLRACTTAMLAVCLLAARGAGAADGTPAVTVFAAASMTDVLTTLGREYEATRGRPVRFSFAASSTLARQLEAGARADVFVSADAEWMDYATARGAIDAASRRVLIGNRLVLVAPKASKVQLRIAPGMNLTRALGTQGRLAMADPDAVPAGRYGRAALTSLGVWNQVQARLIRAENVRAALTFVARGEAPLAIVYRSDAAVEPDVRVLGTFPADSHAPIVYPVALTRSAIPDARGFMDFLTSRARMPAFTRFGFTAP